MWAKVLVGLSAVGAIRACSAALPRTPTSTAAEAPTVVHVAATASAGPQKPVDHHPSVGTKGYLYNDTGSKMIVLYPTEALMDEGTKAAVANDEIGFLQVAERSTLVDQGTDILVIDAGFTYRKVRVMAGRAFGQTGYIPFEFTHSLPLERPAASATPSVAAPKKVGAHH